jgi:hypothetical protein
MALQDPVAFGSLILAAAVVVACAGSIPGLDLRSLVTKPEGGFAKSWAPTFTVFAAVISPLVSNAGTLGTSSRFFSHPSSYATLGVAFGLLVTLAPFLYRAFGTPNPKGGEPDVLGPVWSFLLCTALALWATIGQLATVTFFLLETQPLSIEPLTAFVFAAPFVVVTVALLAHVYRSMKSILDVRARIQDMTRAGPGAQARPTWELF